MLIVKSMASDWLSRLVTSQKRSGAAIGRLQLHYNQGGYKHLDYNLQPLRNYFCVMLYAVIASQFAAFALADATCNANFIILPPGNFSLCHKSTPRFLNPSSSS
jgi:hypothetical protein